MIEEIPFPNTNERKEKPGRTVEFKIGEEVESFDRDTVMEDLGVVDIVRMQPTDFENIDAAPGSLFAHFNIKRSVNKPGEKYLIVRIVGRGAPGREPVLSLDGALIATCVEAESNISYDTLPIGHYLTHSLKGLTDVASLENAMVDRYSVSRGLSREQVIAQGLGYTLFEIVGPSLELKTAPLEIR